MQTSTEIFGGPARRAATTNSSTDSALQDRTISLFGLEITDTTIDSAAHWIAHSARRSQPFSISFLNADCVNIMHRSPAYRDALVQSDRIFADGIGVRIAARLAGYKLRDNVNGTDLFPVLCRHAAAAQVGVFLFGARDGRALAAGQAMKDANPGLTISGCHHGYIQDAADESRLIETINASGAGILFVALGAPVQEIWIARNRHRLKPPIIIGVGGLFDYYSGSVTRAPQAIRNVGMEWAWRLAMEPKRLARRYLLGNAEFLMRVGMRSVLGNRTG